MHSGSLRASVIINPHSGARGGVDAAHLRSSLARSFMASRSVEADVRVTERPGHAADLARDAVTRGASLVCAWGGDGTINEVASALVRQPAALGIIPSGSGNGLARALGIPSRPEHALHHALVSAERAIDVGELGGRFFVNVAGIGVDARVAARFSQGRHRGRLPYVLDTASELCRSRPVEYEVLIGAERLRRTALVVALANSREYGSGAIIAPAAVVDDGLLDLVIVERMPLIRLAFAVPRLFLGTASQHPGVYTRAVADVRISAPEPILFHVDGEPVQGGMELEGRIHAGVLRIRA